MALQSLFISYPIWYPPQILDSPTAFFLILSITPSPDSRWSSLASHVLLYSYFGKSTFSSNIPRSKRYGSQSRCRWLRLVSEGGALILWSTAAWPGRIEVEQDLFRLYPGTYLSHTYNLYGWDQQIVGGEFQTLRPKVLALIYEWVRSLRVCQVHWTRSLSEVARKKFPSCTDSLCDSRWHSVYSRYWRTNRQ